MISFFWIAFLSYSLIVIGTGFFIFRREKKAGFAYDNQEYWMAQRTLSGQSVGLSISASMMSISWSCVYGVQLFYWYGIGAIWLLLTPWLFTMLGFYIFAPLFRKMEMFSQPQLIGSRFGRKSRMLLALALIFVFTVWAGAEIYAAGILIAPFLEISVPLTLLLIAVVVALYSYSGGFRAVIATDKIQYFLVAIFIGILAILSINAVLTHPLTELVSDIFPRPPPKYAICPTVIFTWIWTHYNNLPGLYSRMAGRDRCLASPASCREQS